MKLTWLGHAAFLLEAAGGLRVITDPYAVGGGIAYGPISESADIVTISHEHGDHNNSDAVAGRKETVKGSGQHHVLGLEILGLASYHDAEGGAQRGLNTIFRFSLDGLSLVHLGDLGHTLNEDQVAAIGRPDVLLIPVGGFFTIDAEAAAAVCRQLKPRLVLPMHYKTARCGYPIAPVEEFLKTQPVSRLLQQSTVDVAGADLPAGQEVWVLEPEH